MIWEKNNLWLGLVIGLLLPFVGYALLLTLFEQLEAWGLLSSTGFSPTFRQRTLTIVALCLNIFPFNAFARRRGTNTMRGIAIATVLYAVGWVVYFAQQLL